ncbi:MAG: DnaA N-terminal domain-containing protein, partial [Halanaerobium sp.]
MKLTEKKLNDIWEECLERIKEQLSNPSFKTWFSDTEPIKIKNNVLQLKVPNDFIKDWISSRYQNLIIETI